MVATDLDIDGFPECEMTGMGTMAAVAFRVELTGSALRVELDRWDRLANFRRVVEIDRSAIAKAAVAPRGEVESYIDHRQLGIGTHAGERYPGRRRVGTHLGRGVLGKQFWATARGAPELPLLVLDLVDHEFARAVLAVSDPEVIAALVGPDS
ncbi:MAG: hypothetical protein F4Z00_16390 [Acidimicrobiaceae bacterium]|nr:hypothetical protein [Acidimicrobiaceae bacterium]MXZ67107.1 hypothetical protein [Acidimicrobiaceae bacterium]MYF35083.1 hypothetical protein [Acidimicrobiaceae bacterium]MYG78083.1 hypothetical protein [Acidimicrobiaceae bacterium]MYJ84248.1 hypothetical protein [Acidimicrobiaceae bacterium]